MDSLFIITLQPEVELSDYLQENILQKGNSAWRGKGHCQTRHSSYFSCWVLVAW